MPMRLDSPVEKVKGIGKTNADKLRHAGIETIADLLLLLPLRYQDRSRRATFATAIPGETYTFLATVQSASQYYKGKKSIQRAIFADESGKVNAIWFNNTFINQTLQKALATNKTNSPQYFLVSGSINDKRMLVQATIEKYQIDGESIHTDRIVPLYTQRSKIPVGTIRRILKQLLDSHSELLTKEDWLITQQVQSAFPYIPTLNDTLHSLHFPNNEESIKIARKRLALDEICLLIAHSKSIKETWNKTESHFRIDAKKSARIELPKTIPFKLTSEQKNAIQDIYTDYAQPQPMNRLLVGDVGSGKTIVAGMAALALLNENHNVAFVAPTQILAQQHYQTFCKLFPDIQIKLITGSKQSKTELQTISKKTLFVGTHSVINRLQTIQPALLIFDEQHRFGVNHRSNHLHLLPYTPHLLTMTATPIPRSYMLTIFNHLHTSTIQALPPGRKTTKTWLLPESKRESSYSWIANHITEQKSQIVQVCPFISPSREDAFKEIAAATEYYKNIQKYLKQAFPHIRVGMLHGKLPLKEKELVTQKLYNREIDWLVTTPVIEVGLDLPKADIIIIEGSERFGLASLHQMRGRVGRAGQQGYCLLFTSKNAHQTKERLKYFTTESNGFLLAEYDLKTRGGGNIFNTEQHGQDGLSFADWADLELINNARNIFDTYLDNTSHWNSILSATSQHNQKNKSTQQSKIASN